MTAPPPATARVATAAIVGSVALFAATAALGPSTAEPPLRHRNGFPPYALHAGLPALAVAALLVVAVVLAALGLGLSLRALRDGWRPDARRILAWSLLAVGLLLLVPPIGDADLESYAAYGRVAATGHNPYVVTPLDLARIGDRIGAAVEPPWQDTPSIYGPVATGLQAGIGHAAGSSVYAAVSLNRLVAALAFVLTGFVLQAAARTADARRRCAVLWSANPLLLYPLVGGGHVDAVMVLGITAGVVLAGGARAARIAAGGATLGLAVAVKLPAVLALAGVGWALRRRPARVLLAGGTALVVVAAAYLLAPPHALGQVRHASRFVGPTSPWRAVATFLEHHLAWHVARSIVATLAALTAGALALRLLVRRRPPTGTSVGGAAAAATAALLLAWLLTGTYVLPWYDAAAWAMVCLSAASALDWILLAHTAVLTLAFVPGRDVNLGPVLTGLRQVVHSGIAPIVMALIAIGAVVVTRTRVVAPVPEVVG